MHSSLKVVDFSQFPVELEVSPYRGHSNLSERPEHRAKEAARGSFESLESLVDVLFDDSHQVPKAFVALIYQVLHSIRIPSLEEEHTGKTYAVAVHAVSALRCLVRVADGIGTRRGEKRYLGHREAVDDLPRFVFGPVGAGDFRLAVGAVCIGMSYAYCPKDGVELWMMTLVGKTWMGLLGAKHRKALCQVATLVVRAGIENANLVALMEGLGGSWEDLAALTVTLLKWMVPTEETQVTRDLRPGLIFGKVKGAAAGSLEDLTALAFVLDPRGGYKLEPFVPLVYAVLRDLGIPSLEDLQVTKVLGVVAHAMLALEWLVKLVRAGVVEKGAMLDFGPSPSLG
ncbi:hypothetical protein C8F01DRAFT_1271112 [Mycena amicta]|nr:hypothetical protein C8F01DRAFT_1271112 [Mycena amicta]